MQTAKIVTFFLLAAACLYIGGSCLFFALVTRTVPADMYFHQTKQFWFYSLLLVPGFIFARAAVGGLSSKRSKAFRR